MVNQLISVIYPFKLHKFFAYFNISGQAITMPCCFKSDIPLGSILLIFSNLFHDTPLSFPISPFKYIIFAYIVTVANFIPF